MVVQSIAPKTFLTVHVIFLLTPKSAQDYRVLTSLTTIPSSFVLSDRIHACGVDDAAPSLHLNHLRGYGADDDGRPRSRSCFAIWVTLAAAGITSDERRRDFRSRCIKKCLFSRS